MSSDFYDLYQKIGYNPDILVEFEEGKIAIVVISSSATRNESENKPDNEVFDICKLRKGNYFLNMLKESLNQLGDL